MLAQHDLTLPVQDGGAVSGEARGRPALRVGLVLPLLLLLVRGLMHGLDLMLKHGVAAERGAQGHATRPKGSWHLGGGKQERDLVR